MGCFLVIELICFFFIEEHFNCQDSLLFFCLGVSDGLSQAFLDGSPMSLSQFPKVWLQTQTLCISYFQDILLWGFCPDALTSSLVDLYVSFLQPSHFVCACSKLWTQLTGSKQHLLPHFQLSYLLERALSPFPLFPLTALLQGSCFLPARCNSSLNSARNSLLTAHSFAYSDLCRYLFYKCNLQCDPITFPPTSARKRKSKFDLFLLN